MAITDTEPVKEEAEVPKDLSLHEKTDNATKRLEEANKKTQELLERQERLYENQKLGGKTGGAVEVEEKKEQTPEEYRDSIMAGKIPEEDK